MSPNTRLDLSFVGCLLLSPLLEGFTPLTLPRTRLSAINVKNPFRQATVTEKPTTDQKNLTDSWKGKSRVMDRTLGGDQEQRGGMPDLVGWLKSTESVEQQQLAEESENDDLTSSTILGVGLLSVVVLAGLANHLNLSIPAPQAMTASVERFFADPNRALEEVVSSVESMGPLGMFYFGSVYAVAEVLAVPAIPLTASAGYLFGLLQGTSVVLVSASIAAAISFAIGRTVLRSYVENLLVDYPEFQKIDRAIGKEGFKLMLLLRLSPVFPFALSNYLYGASSVRFWPFFWGTLLGFAPGTMAYVYTGEIGKALTLGSGDVQPWYVYLGGFALLAAFLKVLADVATGIIDDLDKEE